MPPLKVKVYYHDTDSGGVVYYANYLKYLEQARTEFLADHGISVKELADAGTLFVVTRQEVDYKAPAFYADELTVTTGVTPAGPVRFVFVHEIRNQHAVAVAAARTTMVCVDRQIRPKAIPAPIIAALKEGHAL